MACQAIQIWTLINIAFQEGWGYDRWQGLATQVFKCLGRVLPAKQNGPIQ